jgi:hypothetical protein
MRNKTFFIFFTFIIYSVCISNVEAREVEFSWAAMPGATKYEIQVDSDSKFLKPLVLGDSENPEYKTELAFGQYFYRVRVIDNRKRPGKWSNTQPVLIAPYAPELLTMQDSFETSYYEIFPTLNFSWQEVKGVKDYEILISKSSGEKVLEKSLTETHISTDKISEGEYNWKVRSIASKDLVSSYSESRKFKIVRTPLIFPTLVKPEKNGMSAAYRPLEFEWKKDPHAPYSDLYFEKVSGRSASRPFKKKIADLTETKYKAEYEEPGNYKWSVVTHEGKTTPGVTSEVNDFEVRDDIMVRGNYELEFSLSPTGDLYTTTSARQNKGSVGIAQQSSSSGLFTGFMGGYWFLENLGVYLSTRTGSMTVENLNSLSQETDATLRLRFGSKGFNQEFWLGYRIMDIVEAENTPAVQTTDFTAIGPLIGSRINPTIRPGLKLMFDAYYFKPFNNMEGIGGLNADVFGGALGIKWNFMYQIWLGYRFKIDRINANFNMPNQAPSVNASWTMYRTEPFFISLSFEH